MIYSSEVVSFYIFLNGWLVSQFRVFDLNFRQNMADVCSHIEDNDFSRENARQ